MGADRAADARDVTALHGLVRVNARGETTGEADLTAWRQHGGVYLKLGRQRVFLDDAEWTTLVRGIEGGGNQAIPPDTVTRMAELFSLLGALADAPGVLNRTAPEIERWLRRG